MRWIKVSIISILLAIGGYALVIYYWTDESQLITIQKEINYPIDKVFPQFSNLQNFTRWNLYFSDSERLSIQYFEPYQGQGSSLTFQQHSCLESWLFLIKPKMKFQTPQVQNLTLKD